MKKIITLLTLSHIAVFASGVYFNANYDLQNPFVKKGIDINQPDISQVENYFPQEDVFSVVDNAVKPIN